MKTKSTTARSLVPFILLTIFSVHAHLTLSNLEQESAHSLAYSDYSDDNVSDHPKKFDHHQSLKKYVVFGDKLLIKDSGLICKNLRTGGILANYQPSFNNKGCNQLLVKGAKEKNLLNLRSTLCFACPPSLTCTLDKTCGSGSSPTVGCLNISSSLLQNSLKVCSGFGVAAQQATTFVSGTSCSSQISDFTFQGNDFSTIDLTTNLQVEICIPIFFCRKFCDRPTIQATYDENSCQAQSSACVKDRIINEGQDTSCPLNGNSVTTFLGAILHIQKVSCKGAFLRFKLLYQNCLGIVNVGDFGTSCVQELKEEACKQQKLAIEDICKNANLILNSTCFDVKVEGRVL